MSKIIRVTNTDRFPVCRKGWLLLLLLHHMHVYKTLCNIPVCTSIHSSSHPTKLGANRFEQKCQFFRLSSSLSSFLGQLNRPNVNAKGQMMKECVTQLNRHKCVRCNPRERRRRIAKRWSAMQGNPCGRTVGLAGNSITHIRDVRGNSDWTWEQLDAKD